MKLQKFKNNIITHLKNDVIAYLKKCDKYLTFGLVFYFIRRIQVRNTKKIEIIKPSDISYLEQLGINDLPSEEKLEKLKEAYYRANHNRDFEIDKFWSRAAYFWSFLAIIFAVYFGFITTELVKTENTPLKNIVIVFPHIELYIICLGLIFAFAWRYTILGSKQWQENWESHIDKLEGYITGNLYKSIFKKNKFYSVSKINLILSSVIISVWSLILIGYIKRLNAFPSFDKSVDTGIALPIFFSFYIILQFMFGYGRTNIDEDRFIK